MDGEAEARAAAVLEAERELLLPGVLRDVVAFMRNAGCKVPVTDLALLKRTVRDHLTEFGVRMLDAGDRLAHERDTVRTPELRSNRSEEPGPWSEDAKTPVRRRLKKAPQRTRVGRSKSSRPRGHRR